MIQLEELQRQLATVRKEIQNIKEGFKRSLPIINRTEKMYDLTDCSHFKDELVEIQTATCKNSLN